MFEIVFVALFVVLLTAIIVSGFVLAVWFAMGKKKYRVLWSFAAAMIGPVAILGVISYACHLGPGLAPNACPAWFERLLYLIR
jgi:hypothetical protein